MYIQSSKHQEKNTGIFFFPTRGFHLKHDSTKKNTIAIPLRMRKI
jgi:hypothetical protein